MQRQGGSSLGMISMSDKFFLDTNILIYTFDPDSPGNRKIALDLVQRALSTGQGMISYQVIQEFLNVATRKFTRPLSFSDCRTYLYRVLSPLCAVFPSFDFYDRGLDIADRYGYGLYDSLIISAALAGGCSTLFSEDLQHGQKIRELIIINPFISPAPKT